MNQMQPREIEEKLEAVVVELLKAKAAPIDVGRGLLTAAINAMITIGGHDRAIAELTALVKTLTPGSEAPIRLATMADVKPRGNA